MSRGTRERPRRGRVGPALAGGWLALAGLGATAAPAVLQEGPGAEGPGSTDSEVVARYRAAAEGSDRPIDHYNLGTALLLDGRVEEAQAPLQIASRSDRPGVRWRGLYNYGLGAALEGRAAREEGGTAARAGLLAARQAFRQVLRERPADEEARWNLELVERWLEEDERERGGEGSAGGEAESPGGAGAGGAPTGGEGGERELTPEEAAALLERAGQAEADIRDRLMGRNRFQEPVVEKNW